MLPGIAKKVNTIFNNKTVRKVLLKCRYPLFFAFALLTLGYIKREWFIPAVLVSFTGTCIQCWCFATLEKNKIICWKGPYLLVRNPMYIGRYFIIFGFLLLLGNIWILILFAILYYFYMVNRVQREENKLKSIFGEAYEEYCNKVNRFMPSLKNYDHTQFFQFCLTTFLRNNGHWNFTLVLAALLSAFIIVK